MGSLDFGNFLMPQQNQNVVPYRPQAAQAPGAAPDQQKVGLWNAFLTRLAGDKNLQLTLLNSGAQLLQRRPPGQTQAGAIGGAIAGGANLYDKLQTSDLEQQRKDQELALQGRQVAATESNAATAAAAEASLSKYRQDTTPSPEERAADLELKQAQANWYKIRAANQGVNVSVGAEQSLAEMMARAKMATDPQRYPGDENGLNPQAFIDSVRELKTLGKRVKTVAEFKAGLLQGLGSAMAIMKPDERAALDVQINQLVEDYKKQSSGETAPEAPVNRNPQPINIPGLPGAEPPNYVQPIPGGVAPSPAQAPQRSPDFQAADAKFAQEIAKNPNVDRMALVAHIQQYVPGWMPPAAAGQVLR